MGTSLSLYKHEIFSTSALKPTVICIGNNVVYIKNIVVYISKDFIKTRPSIFPVDFNMHFYFT